MSVEILVDRLRTRIASEVKHNHKEMDKGKSQDDYQQLVGKNKALSRMLEIIQEETVRIGQEDEDGG